MKRSGKSPEEGYTKFQVVMFYMDPFDKKNVPGTRYQVSGTLVSLFGKGIF